MNASQGVEGIALVCGLGLLPRSEGWLYRGRDSAASSKRKCIGTDIAPDRPPTMRI